jgi:hypothetical protein
MTNSFDYAVDFYKVYPNRFSEGTLPGPAKAWADPHLVGYNRDTKKRGKKQCLIL